jgi:hypothetical protein
MSANTNSTRRLGVLVLTVSIAVTAVAVFAIARPLAGSGAPRIQDPPRLEGTLEDFVATQTARPHRDAPDADPTELARFREDGAMPRALGEFAGVTLVEHSGPYFPCPEGATGGHALELAAETKFAIFGPTLPSRIEDGFEGGTSLCGQSVVGSGRALVVDGEQYVTVVSQLLPEPWAWSPAPGSRLHEKTLAGHAVISFEPLSPDGRWSGSQVIFQEQHADGFIVTFVEGPNSPQHIVEYVATALIEERSR